VTVLEDAHQRFAAVAAQGGVLQALHGLQASAARAYASAAISLEGPDRGLFRRLADHERDHAAALGSLLGGLPVNLPRPPGFEDVEALAPGLAGAAGRTAALGAAQALEAAELEAFRDALGRLQEPTILKTVLTAMAADGQHRVALRRGLDLAPVPRAFA
jgi:rubrerythrin